MGLGWETWHSESTVTSSITSRRRGDGGRISLLGLILPCPSRQPRVWARPFTILGLQLFPGLRQRCENEGKGHRDPETQPVSKAARKQSQVLLLPPKSQLRFQI